MPEATFHFPRGFLWGTATSSHQVEGHNHNNNWSRWEAQAGRILEGHQSGNACEWWEGRWREDIERAYESNQNSHRLSVEWSRVQPEPDQWDQSALDFYRQICRFIRDLGMVPMVTLHHFTDPIWITEQGGWEKGEIVDDFRKFVGRVVEALREDVTLWVTVNEPNVLATSAYLFGDFPPGKNNLQKTLKVMSNLANAHTAAYKIIHDIQKNAHVGLAINYRGLIPAHRWSPLDQIVTSTQSSLFNNFFPNAALNGVLSYPLFRKRIPGGKDCLDFLGINYYTQDMVSFNLLHPNEFFGHRYFPKGAELSETGHIANQPEGFFNAVKWGLAYNKPLIITENGVEDSKDTLRPRYLIQHLHHLWRAVNFNYPVKGYYHWSLVDNFEWERGWTQRFGLWELDLQTQQRKKRKSADLYAEICSKNGISSEMVANYAPELTPELFPE